MIQPIVEGDGEVAAVPVLLRRLLPELGVYAEIGAPIKQNRYDLVREDKFKRALQLASLKPDAQAVLVLFDADDDCARDIIPVLSAWADQAIAHLPCAVVLARREYEAWLLAAVVSLRGQRRIRDDAEYPADPEAKRGAKGLLGQFMPKNAPYSETADQPALSAVFDLSESHRRCPSFRKLVKEVHRLLYETGQQPSLPPEWTGNV